MEWFGKRDESGKINDFIDPTAKRLDEIEAAINRLHEYVQEIDPDLDEERRLWDDFMNEKHMLAGADHFQYVRDREAAGKRTLRGFRHSIWRDPAKVSGQQQTGE